MDDILFDLSSVIATDIMDLGCDDPKLGGVYIPTSEVESVPKGVTAQFMENADTYHKKYFATGYTDWLLSRAPPKLSVSSKAPLILDIGSGSGPTVFSILKTFSNSRVVAADISPKLLAILRSLVIEKNLDDRVSTICLDLNKSWFRGQPFDLIVGKAILHHLFAPEKLISQVYGAVKPGGSMVFYEPFEAGNAMLSIALRMLLQVSDKEPPLSKHMRAFLTRRIRVVEIMKCEHKDVDVYADIDDKRMFTSNFFREIAHELSAELTISPINSVVTPFQESLRTTFRIALGKGPDVLPEWAWKMLRDIEVSLSQNCLHDCMMAGCVIFTKPILE